MAFETLRMTLNQHRVQRKTYSLNPFNLIKVSTTPYKFDANDQLLGQSIEAGFVVQENNKQRIQMLRCFVNKVKKGKTQKLIRLSRESKGSARKVYAERSLTLSNPLMAVLQAPEAVYF